MSSHLEKLKERLQGQKAKENNKNIWSITLLVKLSVAPSVIEWFLAHLISTGHSTCFSKQNGSKNDVYTTCEQAKWVLQFFFFSHENDISQGGADPSAWVAEQEDTRGRANLQFFF